ncbi:MAG TPA: hypothetical protein VK178_05075 [Opitutaceae bacterium]|nr:hypothetical protein [Opitutaceae bacterium]
MSLVFFHGPFEAGEFTGPGYPRESGLYAYTPIEGAGHEELNLARQSGAEPRCHFDEGAVRTTFAVRSSPRYGRLELTDFETGPVPQ